MNALSNLTDVSQETKHIQYWVYFVTEDAEYGQKLSQQIKHFGYQVQLVKNLAKFENILAGHKTTAILIDLSSTSNSDMISKMFDRIRSGQGTLPPIIFISEHSNQKTRIEAIRAGGQAYFNKPLNIVSLIDKLDSIRLSDDLLTSRVLIVNSQPTLASYYQLILNRSGFITNVVTDSMRVLKHLEDFTPDLVLLDMFMPRISSIELFKMIRQIEAFVSIPVVFLASESDYEMHNELMRLGGDDFLMKPVKAQRLISTIQNRMQRSQTLRSMMVRDSLTGLLNHTSFREQLIHEVNRSKRQNTKLALAMIDLDKFKTVNDTYGHAVGDTVLKSLSRLLQQRLRKSDIIGRYGGEEFVATLLDASLAEAYSIVDEIRDDFAQVRHFSSKSGTFSVTFSCGIATFPQFSNAIVLNDAADRALYAAKAGGRNQIKIASQTGALKTYSQTL